MPRKVHTLGRIALTELLFVLLVPEHVAVEILSVYDTIETVS